ncbi:MAG TPA: TetR/AcrR family transcriptional regulator [Acidimicrobiia bacterium]|nr:TetR/AcrR family transcriptional regulator [Acidimicrobiia bacterium]
MGRPSEHDDTTRAALLAAAERLIDEGGPDAASVRAVADEVGTSTRAIYSVFGSKQGLLEALATRLFEDLNEAIDAVPLTDDPAADLVAAGMQAFRKTVLAHPSLYRLVFLRVVPDLELGPDFGQVAYEAFGRMQALVERVAPDGPAVHQRALAFHALTEGLASMEVRGQMLDQVDAERVWREALTALVRGFESDRASAGRGVPPGRQGR